MEDKNMQFQFMENVVQSGTFLGIPYRNWGEAFVAAACIMGAILIAPFTKIATIMGCIVFGIASFITFLRGYKNRSLTQILFAELKFRANRRVCHLRSPEYARNKQIVVSADMEGQSKASIAFKNVKQKIIEIAKANIEE